MSIPIELIQHYPWLPSLKKHYSDIASIDPTEFIIKIFSNPSNEKLLERIYEFFKAAFDNLEDFHYYQIDDSNIYLYLSLRIILYILNDRRITNRIANLYSKITYRDIKISIEKDNLFTLYNVYRDLDLKFDYLEEPVVYKVKAIDEQREELKTNFRIFFLDYLKLTSNLRDDFRKLINNTLIRGYVYVNPKSLARLIQEYVRYKVIGKSDDTADKDTLKSELMQVDQFKNLVENISNLWKDKSKNFESSFQFEFEEGKDLSNIYPPCLQEILSKAEEGQNLIHPERLNLVWMLLALNYPTDKVVDIFSTMPDFNRERTRYQVNFAQKKAYVPYKCSSLISLNLCMAKKYKDELCLKGYYSKTLDTQKKISHPLFYIRLKKFRASRENKQSNIEEDQKNG